MIKFQRARAWESAIPGQGVSETVSSKATIYPTAGPSNSKEAGDESLLYLQADGSSGKRLFAEHECCDQKGRLILG